MFLNPSVIVFMFDTILGNLILGLCVIGVGIVDIKYAIGMASIFIMLYQAFHIADVKKREGATNMGSVFGVGWDDKLKADFLQFQKTTNPNVVFDINIIQKQATANEARDLLKTGSWYWSPEVKQLYKDAVSNNTILSSDPLASLTDALTIYNETAIKEILSWNSKEGVFLLNGAIIGHTENTPDNVNNIVKCGINDSGSMSMQKIVYTGYNSSTGGLNSRVTPVSNSDLPKIMNGFRFLGDACNPCNALNDPPDYSCPFSLNTGNGYKVSKIWDMLWKKTGNYSASSSASSSTDSRPQDVNSPAVFLDKTKFPIINQLKDEIIKGSTFINVDWRKLSSSVTIKDPDVRTVYGGDNVDSITESDVPPFVTKGDHSRDYDKNSYETRSTNMF